MTDENSYLDKQIGGIDDFIDRFFCADFRDSLTRLINQTTQTVANKVFTDTIRSFATALQEVDIICTIEEVEGKQVVRLKANAPKEITTVTKHDTKGRVIEFEKVRVRS